MVAMDTITRMATGRNDRPGEVDISKEMKKSWPEIKWGGEKAFYTLYTSLFPALVGYVRQIVKDLHLAEDIVQEVFIKLWCERESIKITGSVQVYIYKTAHHAAINKLQHLATAKNKVNRTISEEEWQFIRDTYQVDDFIVENIEKDETDMLIQQTIAGLPEKCREAFVLSRYEYLNHEEIAQRMDISVNTVRAHIYHALEVIRERLKTK
jgi:RNA polymerase sigma-70 factor (ECF subfamily)